MIHLFPPRQLRVLVLALLPVILFSACSSNNSDSRPREVQMTDFRVGNVYQLKVPAFILANSGLLVTAQEAQQKPPEQAEALLEPGTYFKVRQIKCVDDRKGGPRTDIYAEIISGPRNGRVVNLRTASLQDSATGGTRRDRAVFEPFFMGR